MVHVLVPGDDCGGGDGGERGKGPPGGLHVRELGVGDRADDGGGGGVRGYLLVVGGRSMAATWDQVRPANLTRLLILLTFIGFQNK